MLGETFGSLWNTERELGTTSLCRGEKYYNSESEFVCTKNERSHFEYKWKRGDLLLARTTGKASWKRRLLGRSLRMHKTWA